MSDACSTCGAVRKKWARWFYIYPDILPPGNLVPIAIYCKLCVPIGYAADRLARWHRSHEHRQRR